MINLQKNIFNKKLKITIFFLITNNTTKLTCGKIQSKLSITKSKEELLEKAIKRHEINTVKSLIEAGAKINSRDRLSRTKLMLAAMMNNPQIIQELLKHGADQSARTKDGKTALMYAAAKSPKVLNQLLANTEQINLSNRKGYTPLMYATICGQTENIKTLIKNKANLEAQNDQGFTPLILAARNQQNDSLINLIQEGAQINHQDLQGKTALMHAVNTGNVKTIRTLLEAQPNLEIMDQENQTALSIALTKNKPSIYLQLKTAGASDQGLHEFGSVIFDLDNFNTYVTQELTLQNEEPSKYINYLQHMFRINKATGRKYITKQEIVNWINGQLMLQKKTAFAELNEEEQSVVELRTTCRPFLVQKATADKINTTVRLSDGNFASYIEPCLIKSLKYWRTQNMSDEQFNEFLAEGDKHINPIEGDQVLITQDQAAQFLILQAKHPELPHQKYLTGQSLVQLLQKKGSN